MDYLALASNPETVDKAEGCMKVWIKQTEQVIPRNPWLISDATSLGLLLEKVPPWHSHCPHITAHALKKISRSFYLFVCLIFETVFCV